MDRAVRFLDHDHKRVEMNGQNRGLKWRCPAGQPYVVRISHERVQVVGQRVGIRCKSIADTMHIFAEVDAAGAKVGQRLLERDYLLLGLVSAIVDENVYGRRLLTKLSPELPICLVSDKDRRLLTFVRSARFLNIYAGDAALRTKV